MTLSKLTLSISLLAASLMLAAPAQAETWICFHISKVSGDALTNSFERMDNGTFKWNIGSPRDDQTLKILWEGPQTILLSGVFRHYFSENPDIISVKLSRGDPEAQKPFQPNFAFARVKGRFNDDGSVRRELYWVPSYVGDCTIVEAGE